MLQKRSIYKRLAILVIYYLQDGQRLSFHSLLEASGRVAAKLVGRIGHRIGLMMEKANSQFTWAGWRWPKVRVSKIDQRCGTIFCRIPNFESSKHSRWVDFQGLLLLPSLLGILFAGAAYVPLPFAARPLHEVDFCYRALCHMVKYGWWRPMG